ncbi:MAG: MarR family transcriptional regulator [Lentisphaeria bacterium]|nr:MarR family transcriptional regulator [Lentisphaeria bacterium]MBR7118764.1 MarR family transcriptional regulator [Lentisphaeria bacterium]
MAEYDIASLFKRLLSASGVLRDDQGQQSEERQLFKLTLNQLRMVKNVHGLVGESGSGVKLKALAESLDITPAAASEMVETLVGKGVLTRVSSALDRRSVSIKLGDKLQKRIRNREESFDRLALEYIASLPQEDSEKFLSILEGFVAHLEQAVAAKETEKK